jgi:hypothetical protein
MRQNFQARQNARHIFVKVFLQMCDKLFRISDVRQVIYDVWMCNMFDMVFGVRAASQISDNIQLMDTTNNK